MPKVAFGPGILAAIFQHIDEHPLQHGAVGVEQRKIGGDLVHHLMSLQWHRQLVQGAADQLGQGLPLPSQGEATDCNLAMSSRLFTSWWY